MLTLEKGIKITLQETVTNENTAATLGSGSLPVYGTPAMIALIEKSAVELVKDYLPEETTTVGTKLDVQHVSATPLGMQVSCTCTLIGIDRRRLVFEVEVRDEAGVIGTGTHERFMVEADSFLKKTEGKNNQ